MSSANPSTNTAVARTIAFALTSIMLALPVLAKAQVKTPYERLKESDRQLVDDEITTINEARKNNIGIRILTQESPHPYWQLVPTDLSDKDLQNYIATNTVFLRAAKEIQKEARHQAMDRPHHSPLFSRRHRIHNSR